MDKVTIYGQKNEIVGETFQRRAKQLVLKGRATWLNEGSAIMLQAKAPEEDKMENNGYIDLRETAEAHTAPHMPSEDLLMHLAKRNLRKRRELLIHIAAYIISFGLLAFITNGFSGGRGLSWDFYFGVYMTWGVFVAHKLIVQVREWLTRRRPAPDALKAEYERLKSTPPTKINL